MISYKTKLAIIAILIVTAAGAGWFYYCWKNSNTRNTTNENASQQSLRNNVVVVSKVDVPALEKEQLVQSVDTFMNEYKLPKGVRNSYAVSIEKRLNNAMKIIVNPGEKGDLGNITIYARKTDSTWQVDANAGPWCTLEEFEQRSC